MEKTDEPHTLLQKKQLKLNPDSDDGNFVPPDFEDFKKSPQDSQSKIYKKLSVDYKTGKVTGKGVSDFDTLEVNDYTKNKYDGTEKHTCNFFLV